MGFRKLRNKAIGLSVVFFASSAFAGDSDLKVTTSPSIGVLTRNLAPLFRLEASRGGIFSEVAAKNPWFKDLKSDLLGLGLSRELGRTWLSLPDQEGEGVGAWKGVFLEYLFGKLFKTQPVSLLVFDSPALIGSWAFTVRGLKGDSADDWKVLLKRLKTGKEFSVADPSTGKKFDGRFVALRGRILAWVDEGGCSSLSLDPMIAARAVQLCEPELALGSEEVGIQLELDQFYSATRVLRKKVAGLESKSRVFWHFNSAQGTLESPRGELYADPKVADQALAQSSWNDDFLRALPVDVLHFAGVSLNAPPGFNFSIKSLSAWLSRKGNAPAGTAIQGVLAHLGYEAGVPLSVLLVSQGGQSTVGKVIAPLVNLAVGLKGAFSSEKHPLNIRSVCKGTLWAIAPSKEALDRVEATCGGKGPSLASTLKAGAQTSQKGTRSLSAYFNPGVALMKKFQIGLSLKKDEIPDPAVFDSTRLLLGRIPNVWLSGTYQAGSKTIALKSTL